jgi:signal peptidase I
MEGVLNDRDVILVNHADTSPGAGLYVLRIEGDLLVKRVQKLPGGKLEIMSANEAYRPFEIDPAIQAVILQSLARGLVWPPTLIHSISANNLLNVPFLAFLGRIFRKI